MMVFSFSFAAVTGNMENTLHAFLDSGKKAVDFVLSTGGIMAMWSGFMAVAQKSGLAKAISSVLSPVISVLFKGVKKDSPAAGAISMNMVANFLGLSNGATPLGIKAMKELAVLDGNKRASHNMCMLTIINSASIQLIPSTLIAIRSAMGSGNPGEIILPIWIVSVITAVSGVAAAKFFRAREEI